MSDRTLSVHTYVVVLVLLTLLTFLTVGVSLIPLAGRWHIAIGLSIAFVKASLVALFFMHVIFSHRLTWTIIAVSLLWIFILVSLTFTDYLTRGWDPTMWGH